MKIGKLIFFHLAALLLITCHHPEDESTLPQKQDKKTVIIQPFSGMPGKEVRFVFEQLKQLHPDVILADPIDLPQTAYYKPRNRYRADSLIRYLRSKTPAGHITIGITNQDISHTKGTIQDYGLMGLGYQPGPSCVVSTHRLSKTNLAEQLFKLSVHELGHTHGLPHCPVKTCFMRDAEGKNHTNEETGFCPTCMEHLISKGWGFEL
jgi:archaemetzincin